MVTYRGKVKSPDSPTPPEEAVQFPQTYIVLKFSPRANEKALDWFISKIRGEKPDGGAELLIRRQPYKENEGLILHISASKIKFLQVAEEIEVMKKDHSGVIREFVVSQMEEFIEEGAPLDDFLTTAERQTIVRHELENIRVLPDEHAVPGYNQYRLQQGQSILQTFIREGIIDKIYSLHDNEALKRLSTNWVLALFQKQPYEEIRVYFGESVALYFIFIGFYTTALLFPTLLGVIQLFMGHETLMWFCIINVLWVIVFLEVWRRKSNELAFNWGTIGMTSLDEPRANFRGLMGIDAVTGKALPQAPRWKTNVKLYCISLPLVLLCLYGGFLIMLWSFWAEDELKATGTCDADSWCILVPSIIYTAIVYVVNLWYRSFATYLTEWENHRTQSQYDRHRVIKLVLFEFVNNFMSLFYIVVVLRDLEMLRQQVATMLIILQAINHVQEALLPLLMTSAGRKMCGFKGWSSDKKDDEKTPSSFTSGVSALPNILQDVECLQYDDPRIHQADLEGEMEDYEGTYDDYLELFIQFGYVVLFTSIYPLAAFWAVANNILEIRADAFKLCKVYRRPMARKVKDTGAWQRSFEIVGALSIVTNLCLLWLSPQVRDLAAAREMDSTQLAFHFILVEHVLLCIRYILHQAIPDKPEWVRIGLGRKNHVCKMALKNERLQKNNRVLSRRFMSVYGTTKI